MGEAAGRKRHSSVLTPPSNFVLLSSVGKSHENEVRYHPFRMTPYLVQVPEQRGAESQLCCVLLAERALSGYEGDGRPGPPGLLWSSVPPVGQTLVCGGTPAQLPQPWAESHVPRHSAHPPVSPSPPGPPPCSVTGSVCQHPSPMPRPWPGPWVLCFPRLLPSIRVVAAALTGPEPVSYTHLTLPTIRA